MNTNDLSLKKVLSHRPRKNDPDNTKKVGRIHAFVFHPKRARLVGYLVKRPDLVLMFHRDDVFVAVDGFEDIDGMLVVKDDEGAYGRLAEKALAKADGTKLDDCILWIGLPVITEDGKALGTAESVEFDPDTGDVIYLELSLGATANTILGRRRIPASMIRGFKRGQGARLSAVFEEGGEGSGEDGSSFGAVVVASDAVEVQVEGGVAEKAGAASAVATDKAKRTYKKVVKKAGDLTRKAEPKVKEATKAAGEAVQKGVYATGRQVARAGGMFSDFKREFQRAMNDKDSDDE